MAQKLQMTKQVDFLPKFLQEGPRSVERLANLYRRPDLDLHLLMQVC